MRLSSAYKEIVDFCQGRTFSHRHQDRAYLLLGIVIVCDDDYDDAFSVREASLCDASWLVSAEQLISVMKYVVLYLTNEKSTKECKAFLLQQID